MCQIRWGFPPVESKNSHRKKTRELMGEWAFTPTPELGVLRGLEIGQRVEYHLNCRDEDRLLFLDGAMQQVSAVY